MLGCSLPRAGTNGGFMGWISDFSELKNVQTTHKALWWAPIWYFPSVQLNSDSVIYNRINPMLALIDLNFIFLWVHSYLKSPPSPSHPLWFGTTVYAGHCSGMAYAVSWNPCHDQYFYPRWWYRARGHFGHFPEVISGYAIWTQVMNFTISFITSHCLWNV